MYYMFMFPLKNLARKWLITNVRAPTQLHSLDTQTGFYI